MKRNSKSRPVAFPEPAPVIYKRPALYPFLSVTTYDLDAPNTSEPTKIHRILLFVLSIKSGSISGVNEHFIIRSPWVSHGYQTTPLQDAESLHITALMTRCRLPVPGALSRAAE